MVLLGRDDPQNIAFSEFFLSKESGKFRNDLMSLRLDLMTANLISGSPYARFGSSRKAAIAVAGHINGWLKPASVRVPAGFLGKDSGSTRRLSEYRARAADLVAFGAALNAVAGSEVFSPHTALKLAFGIDPLVVRIGDMILHYPFGNELPSLPAKYRKFEAILGNTCVAGLNKALGDFGRAASAMPRAWTQGRIERVDPANGCAGETITLFGSNFGTAQPGDVRVFFTAAGGGCAEARIESWSDNEIRVTAPSGVGQGCIGLMQDPASAAGGLTAAADALSGVMQGCLGPVAFGASLNIGRIAAALGAASCPDCNNPAARFGGGPPKIESFTVNGGQVADLAPGDSASFDWHVKGATSIEINPLLNPALPMLSGPFGIQGGPVTSGPISLQDGDGGEYELVAANRCGVVRARCAIVCRGKQALVLSGGGTKGAFEAGAARCLYDVKKVRPDIIAGASAGALNAAKLAEGGVALQQLEQLWLGLVTESDFYREEPWLQTLQAAIKKMLRGDASNILLQGGGAAASFANGQSMRGLAGLASIQGSGLTVLTSLYATVTFAIDAAKLIDAAAKAFAARNLFDNSALVALIARNIDPARVARSGIDLRITMVSMNTGRSVVVQGARSNWPLHDVLLASASIPVAFPPVPFIMPTGLTEHFIDGGTRDNLPIRSAVEAGAARVYAVLVSPKAIEVDQANFGVAKIPGLAVRSLLCVLDETQQDDLAPFRGFGVPVTTAAPSFLVHDTLDVEPGLISINMDYGYLRAYDEWVAPAAEQARLRNNTDAIITARLDAWRTEHDVSGEQILPFDPTLRAVKVPDPLALQQLRDVKRRIHQLVEWRVTRYGRQSAPVGASSWWLAFERHPWTPVIPTPWDSFSSRLGTLPVEPPPPAL